MIYYKCRLFELFLSILDLLIQNARTEGHLDSGIVDIKANIIELQGTPKVLLFLSLYLFPIWTAIYIDNFADCTYRQPVRGVHCIIYFYIGPWNDLGGSLISRHGYVSPRSNFISM